MTGHQDNGQAAPITGAALAVAPFTPGLRESLAAALERSLALPCRCWSCDGQCGGSNNPAHGSCGPLADLDGRPVCQACRDAADVIDTERAGAKVTLDQDKVRLRSDVWNPSAASLWLDARSARHLGLVLIARAAELDLAEAAAVGDDEGPDVVPASVVGDRVSPIEDDSPVPLAGTIVALTGDPGFVMVAWDDRDGTAFGPVREAFDGLRPR